MHDQVLIYQALVASIHSSQDDNPVWLLNHRTRRRIILAIGDAGRISASALRASLKISTGSLYYNLKQLEMFVAQDGKRNYYLTERGLEIYKMLKEGDAVLLESKNVRQGFFERIFSLVINPVWILGPALERLPIAATIGGLSLLLTAALYVNGKVSLIGVNVYHWKNFSLENTLSTMSLTILSIYFYLSFLANIYDELRQRRLMGSMESGGLQRVKNFILHTLTFGGSPIKGLAAVCIGILPMSLYPILIFLAKVNRWDWIYSPGSVIPISLPANITLVLSQFASFLILASSLSYLRSIRWHIAALICLSLIYLSIVLQYIILGAVPPQS
ncbi:MAG: helix-turn-helix domain-containing protein [Nitrososphaerota archaeon]